MVPDPHRPITLSTVHAQALPERLLGSPGEKYVLEMVPKINNMDDHLTVFGVAYLVYKCR